MIKKMSKLPRLWLDNSIIMRYVDGCRDLVGFPSELSGIDYATDGRDVLIISSRGGYLRINAQVLKKFTKELEWLDEEVERRSRD